MTEYKRSNPNNSELNASEPTTLLRRCLAPARLALRSHHHHLDNNSRDETSPHHQSYLSTPRGWNRSRTLSGELPKRKVSDYDDDLSETEEEDEVVEVNNCITASTTTTTSPASSSLWSPASLTPPRTVARVDAASAPRQRKPICRSPSPSAFRRRIILEPDSWLIPHQHPVKVFWDVCTVLLSIANAYATHMAIRDREFQSPFIRFCEIWFVLDILLNFCVQRTTSDGTVLRTFRAVCARYLTSWFVVDVLSLIPAELLFLQPVVEAQKRRTFWQKGFFRTKAVVKVTRWLRLQHVRYLTRISQHTKRAAGIGASRLVRLAIRYAPKYILFIRKTRGVLCVRLLRQIRWMRQMYRDFIGNQQRRQGGVANRRASLLSKDNATVNLTEDDANDALAVADWEVLEDDDPF